MKRLGTILILLVSLTLTGCISKTKVLSRLDGYPRSESVRIPKRTIVMGSLFASEYGNMVRDIKCVETFECSDPASFDDIETDAKQLVGSMGMELYIESSEKGEKSTIYGSGATDDGILRRIVILSREKGEYSVVYIEGKFDLKSYMNRFTFDD